MGMVFFAAVIFLAAVVQSVTGFGFALVAMAVLPGMIGLQMAAPLVAVVGILNSAILWIYYRRGFDPKIVSRLVLGTLLTIPLGIFLLRRLPETIALTVLGILITTYAVYVLAGLMLPALRSPWWAYLFGAIAGLTSGAYSVGGPPVVIYGQCCRWSPTAFRSNLPAFFFINAIGVVTGHGLQGNLTPEVLRMGAIAVLPLVIGIAIGTWIAQNLNPKLFQRVVLILLIITGLKLILAH